MTENRINSSQPQQPTIAQSHTKDSRVRLGGAFRLPMHAPRVRLGGAFRLPTPASRVRLGGAFRLPASMRIGN